MIFEADEKFWIENILSRLTRSTPYMYTNTHTSSLSFSKLVEWRLKKNNSFDNQKVSGNDPLHITTWVELKAAGKDAVQKFFIAFDIDPFNPEKETQICYSQRLVSYLKKLKWTTEELNSKEAKSHGDAKLTYRYFGQDEEDLAKVPYLFDTRTTLTGIVQKSQLEPVQSVLEKYRQGSEDVFFVPKKGHLTGRKLRLTEDVSQRILGKEGPCVTTTLVPSMDVLNTQECVKRLNKEKLAYEDGYLIHIKDRTIRIYPYFTCDYCTVISTRLNFYIPF